jgi:hypothetical protein
MVPEIRDERQMRALTGVPTEKFSTLEAAFGLALDDEKERAYREGLAKGKRQRKPGGGQKGKLSSVHDKLIFLLYYLKVYPTFDVLGAQFGINRSKACENVHALRPILYKALENLGVMPHREFKTVEEFRAACDWVDDLLIDATERPHSRPTDDAKQKDLYSGKKKRHSVKNTIMSTIAKWIIFVGDTFSGHEHDYTMLKTEFPPEHPWFENIHVLLDLGYQGILDDYDGENIEIPHKKPRKSKKNPQPELTSEQKTENQALSRVRIFVENAIAGIKRFNILVHAFRNRKPTMVDDVIAVCAGLWNFSLL